MRADFRKLHIQAGPHLLNPATEATSFSRAWWLRSRCRILKQRLSEQGYCAVAMTVSKPRWLLNTEVERDVQAVFGPIPIEYHTVSHHVRLEATLGVLPDGQR